MSKQKDALEEQVPSYGVEALVSMIEDDDSLIAALKEAGKRFPILKRRLDGHTG
jgi:hypothetical protein